MNDWIKVTELLPPRCKTVLTIGVRCGPKNNYTTDPYCVWLTNSDRWVRWPHPFPPTHWQPLPEPPEES